MIDRKIEVAQRTIDAYYSWLKESKYKYEFDDIEKKYILRKAETFISDDDNEIAETYEKYGRKFIHNFSEVFRHILSTDPEFGSGEIAQYPVIETMMNLNECGIDDIKEYEGLPEFEESRMYANFCANKANMIFFAFKNYSGMMQDLIEINEAEVYQLYSKAAENTKIKVYRSRIYRNAGEFAELMSKKYENEQEKSIESLKMALKYYESELETAKGYGTGLAMADIADVSNKIFIKINNIEYAEKAYKNYENSYDILRNYNDAAAINNVSRAGKVAYSALKRLEKEKNKGEITENDYQEKAMIWAQRCISAKEFSAANEGIGTDDYALDLFCAGYASLKKYEIEKDEKYLEHAKERLRYYKAYYEENEEYIESYEKHKFNLMQDTYNMSVDALETENVEKKNQ